MKHLISIQVKDRFGTLARVVEMFTSRGYNLDSVCTGESEVPGVHKITLGTSGDDKKIKQILKLLKNIVYVYKVTHLEPEQSFSAELMLVKIKAPETLRSKALELIQSLGGEVLEINHLALTFQITGSASKLDGATEVFREFEILELARTGEAAIHK
ncbi:MAG: acetolactate synthase small subunit [Candidatus Lambdaproteobacteria bacterium RIFOXYD1_FULL_56_27]|uniref:Acetolactate synthase small subunit n=1 Tax=Candidatus Lambdaproteobacteria bacterium RIFOXYD2_FULL_56_26 TaxID=1817773 RepID=A0A1F6GXN0_9PROT|nr:MAG: acetolactate synthase small subunit [Candidatus Lambdaproteobacteria bacterium RIFOXYC1_FULL_56_13]OGH02801.1 MAG: acetolactate synthase small subunit [Candidatus Lambdaproteobacteria bacterium RIFOXYD2_FULL_56_26]OGH08044.1 MAG: acetolactate synthase small subunit [Candidatus Lambdaproteobacteria bacterium RIFOXYD1_FULL_56_27]